jgi:hypothetical protein
MSLNLSEIVVPTFVGGLGTLKTVLERAAEHAEAKKLDVSSLLQARLYDDMYTFTQQIQAATDTARRVGQRLAGVEPSSMPDPEGTFAALGARVQETLALVREFDPAAIDERQDVSFMVNLGMDLTFTGRSYALTFAVPNFLFHVSMAYGLMRHRGVQLGKVDYIAPFMQQ